ncbi:hypothetical protein Btru_005407 [Bulinus truncatus]|nr:hypothetical protein Btru_005407 [Bulinus truncatus]
MIFIKKWQRFVKLLLFLIAILVIWQVIQPLSKIDSGDYYYDRNSKIFTDHWGLNNDDIEWLPSILHSKSDQLPIVIVEEHYEVLKYWFQAAELGLISKSRNILIHIDGHVDGAIPYDTDSIPLFRFPVTRKEIHNMMQRNDMFLVAAALTGLVDHVVWVWPHWDTDNHDSDWSHVIFDIHLGYLKVNDETRANEHKYDLCACWKRRRSIEEDKKDTLKEDIWHCHRRNFTELEAQDGPKISQDECKFQADAVLEIMSEATASTKLQKMYPAHVSAVVILDIDEDFFGCWSDMFPLQKAGTQQKSIELLSEIVADVLCAENAMQEKTADMYFTALVNLVIALKSQTCDVNDQHLIKVNKQCKTSVGMSNFIIENIPNLLNFLVDQGHEPLLCHKEPKLRGLFMQSMMQLLLNFSVKELKLIIDIGICFEVSPSLRYFDLSGKLHVCHGENMPKKSEVSFYYPPASEVSTQNVTLRKIISSIFRKPDIITVCRSVRDGYTPKTLQTVIESNIIKTISNSYRSAHIDKVHYDNNLLGGKTGWPQRSMGWADKLLQYLSVNSIHDH